MYIHSSICIQLFNNYVQKICIMSQSLLTVGLLGSENTDTA